MDNRIEKYLKIVNNNFLKSLLLLFNFQYAGIM